MWRSLLAVVAGTVLALALIGVIDAVNHRLFPPPEAVAIAARRRDMQAVAAAVGDWLPSAPLAALVLTSGAWVLGTLAGSLAAALIASRSPVTHALLAGALPLAGTALNLWMIPHPLWVAIAGLAGVPLAAVAGGLIAGRRQRSGPQPYDMRERNMAC